MTITESPSPDFNEDPGLFLNYSCNCRRDLSVKHALKDVPWALPIPHYYGQRAFTPRITHFIPSGGSSSIANVALSLMHLSVEYYKVGIRSLCYDTLVQPVHRSRKSCTLANIVSDSLYRQACAVLSGMCLQRADGRDRRAESRMQ